MRWASGSAVEVRGELVHAVGHGAGAEAGDGGEREGEAGHQDAHHGCDRDHDTEVGEDAAEAEASARDMGSRVRDRLRPA